MQVKEGCSGESPAGKWAEVPTPVPEIDSWGNLVAYSSHRKISSRPLQSNLRQSRILSWLNHLFDFDFWKGVQALPTRVYGPLLRDTKGLLLGKSSTNIQGIFLAPGVINADFEGEIKVMTHSSNGILSTRQAFLIILQVRELWSLPMLPWKYNFKR